MILLIKSFLSLLWVNRSTGAQRGQKSGWHHPDFTGSLLPTKTEKEKERKLGFVEPFRPVLIQNLSWRVEMLRETPIFEVKILGQKIQNLEIKRL